MEMCNQIMLIGLHLQIKRKFATMSTFVTFRSSWRNFTREISVVWKHVIILTLIPILHWLSFGILVELFS